MFRLRNKKLFLIIHYYLGTCYIQGKAAEGQFRGDSGAGAFKLRLTSALDQLLLQKYSQFSIIAAFFFRISLTYKYIIVTTCALQK